MRDCGSEEYPAVESIGDRMSRSQDPARPAAYVVPLPYKDPTVDLRSKMYGARFEQGYCMVCY